MGSARYQLKLAYDGTRFFGFQRQAEDRTVQLVVEAALRKLGWKGDSILFAGRTDTGVHASGQVICFDLDWTHTDQKLIQALNANLPDDVSAKQIQVVNENFHPRFDARVRTYRYRIVCSDTREPLEERYAWRVWPKLNDSLLMQAAAVLPGVYDCAAFGTPPKKGGHTVRAIYNASWVQTDETHYQFTISANAFLYHMVRRIVNCQVKIGLSRMPLEEFSNAIKAKEMLKSGLAPANGLDLLEVRYSLSEQEYQLIKTSGHYHLEFSETGE